MGEREDDFLGRWSRRKAEARDGGLRKKSETPEEPVHKPGRMRTEPLPPKAEQAAPSEDAVESDALVREAALRESHEEDQGPALPDEGPAGGDNGPDAETQNEEDFENFDFDSLDYDSDYTRFMGKNVPEAVRRRALRMLWGSNPILANIDGLNDYDEDFTDAALAVTGLLKTSYKVGSGYLTEEERQAGYSDEAREAGPKPVEGEGEAQVAEAGKAGGEDDAAGVSAKDTGTGEDAGGPEAEERKSAASAQSGEKDIEIADAGDGDGEEDDDDNLGEADDMV